MRFPRLAILAVAMAGPIGCGDGSDDAQAPASGAERRAIAEYKYCVEGAGAQTANPGESVAGIGSPSGPDVEHARRGLLVYWGATGDRAHVYYAEDQADAEAAARRFDPDALQKGNLVVVADPDNPPSPDDEQLLLEDCLL